MHQNENDAPALLDSTEAPRIAETLNRRAQRLRGGAQSLQVFACRSRTKLGVNDDLLCQWINCRIAQKMHPASSAAAGSVNTQASAMFRIVESCSPLPLAIMVPAMPDDSTWVVDTGILNWSAAMMVQAATISAEAPCAYVRCSFPIFSPTVTTMRFQPTIVPSPSASATATFTHEGMNLVELSRCFL